MNRFTSLTLIMVVAAACLSGQSVDYRNVKNGPSQSIAEYQFTLKSGNVTSGSIATSGAKTLTIRPCPKGVAGTNTNHYIRISGGTGTAEQALITGGNCTSGASSGTLEFTTANTHTGSWSITSATGGLQEWFYGAPTPLNGFLPPGTTTLYGKLTLYGRSGTTVQITGSGNPATQLSRSSSYPAGDLIHYNGATAAGQIILNNFAIVNAAGFDNTSGSGLHLAITQPREAILQDVTVYNGVSPILVDSGGSVIMDRVYVSIQSAYSASYTTGDGITLNVAEATLTDVRSSRDTKTATGGSGLKIIRADGLRVLGGHYNGTYGILVQNDAAYNLNFLYIDDAIIDETYSHGIYFPTGAHNTIYNQVRIQNSHFATQDGDNNAAGIYIGNDVGALIIDGNNISGFEGPGIVLGLADAVPRGAVVSNNQINNNGRTGSRYGIVISPTGTSGSGSYDANTSIIGNTIGNNLALAYGASPQEIGIYFAGSAGKFRGYTISGNTLKGNSVGAIVKDATPTAEALAIGTNAGVSDFITLIASGSLSAAEATAMYRNIEVSGTTNITSLTPVWDQRVITFLKTDAGTANFVTGGNIAANVALAQNAMVVCQYYVAYTKWICK